MQYFNPQDPVDRALEEITRMGRLATDAKCSTEELQTRYPTLSNEELRLFYRIIGERSGRRLDVRCSGRSTQMLRAACDWAREGGNALLFHTAMHHFDHTWSLLERHVPDAVPSQHRSIAIVGKGKVLLKAVSTIDWSETRVLMGREVLPNSCKGIVRSKLFIDHHAREQFSDERLTRMGKANAAIERSEGMQERWVDGRSVEARKLRKESPRVALARLFK